MPESGNSAQVRIIADQVAETAITRFAAEHPEIARRSEIPPPLKWAGGIAAGILSMGVGAMAVWLVSTVNDMQVTLARMDERMESSTVNQSSQFDEINRRITRLEAYHAKGGEP